jgi:hypothetical protein
MQTWQEENAAPGGVDVMESAGLLLTDYAHKVATSQQIVTPGKVIEHKRDRTATFGLLSCGSYIRVE